MWYNYYFLSFLLFFLENVLFCFQKEWRGIIMTEKNDHSKK